jgi:glutamyl-tRNA synthetase
MGLDWDETPVEQSKRFDVYRQVAQKLLDEGKAFRCGYTDAELGGDAREGAKGRQALALPL